MDDLKNFKRISGNISKELANKMCEAYDKKRSRNVNGSGKEDTKSVYISKAELEAFLAVNKTAKGIRVYFGIVGDYGIQNQNQAHLKKYKDQTTIILMPTEAEDKLINDSSPLIFGSYIQGEPFDENDLCPPAPDGSNNCAVIN